MKLLQKSWLKRSSDAVVEMRVNKKMEKFTSMIKRSVICMLQSSQSELQELVLKRKSIQKWRVLILRYKIIKPMRSIADGLSFEKYQIVVSGIKNNASLRQIEDEMQYAVGMISNIEVRFMPRNLLNATFITELCEDEFIDFKRDYLSVKSVNTSLGNLSFKATRIQSKNSETRQRRIRIRQQSSNKNDLQIYLVAIILILGLLYVGYLWSNAASQPNNPNMEQNPSHKYIANNHIEIKSPANPKAHEQTAEKEKPTKWQKRTKIEQERQESEEKVNLEMLRKPVEEKNEQEQKLSQRAATEKHHQFDQIEDRQKNDDEYINPPPTNDPPQHHQIIQQQKQTPKTNAPSADHLKTKSKYSKEQLKKMEEEAMAKLPNLHIVNDNPQKFVFKVGGKQYIAHKEVRQAITDSKKTLVQGLEYLRNSETEVFTFPKDQWIKPEKKTLEFTKIANFEEADEKVHKRSRDKSRSEVLFYKNMSKNPTDANNLQAQYFFLNKTFNLDKQISEKPLCVVATGYNMVVGSKYQNFLQSMNAQNYTNFKVYYVDDSSPDNTTLRVYAEISDTYPRLRDKFILLRNNKNLGAFSNKDSAIKENCAADSIVIDIDSDDGLIGNQVFNCINRAYEIGNKPWVVYSNFLISKYGNKYQKGFSTKLDISYSDYRRSGISYRTSHLKTYLAKLEWKIPLEYLTVPNKDSEGRSYTRYASDATMMYNLLELAGDQRVAFLPFLFYWYRLNQEFTDACHHALQFYEGLKMRTMRPLKPLKSLESEAVINMSNNLQQLSLQNAEKDYYRDCNIQTSDTQKQDPANNPDQQTDDQ